MTTQLANGGGARIHKPSFFPESTSMVDGAPLGPSPHMRQHAWTGGIGGTRGWRLDAGVRVPAPQESCLQDDEWAQTPGPAFLHLPKPPPQAFAAAAVTIIASDPITDPRAPAASSSSCHDVRTMAETHPAWEQCWSRRTNLSKAVPAAVIPVAPALWAHSQRS